MDRANLSHDAFQLNGSYLEDLIVGYKTVKAAGRESLEKNIDSYENGTDGENIRRTRYPKRTIEISYVVKGSSLADLRGKMHKLQTLLNVQDAEIIFNDDENCYYTATPVMSNTVSPGWNTAHGTYSLICFDPFKYSKTITTVGTTTYSEQVTDEDGNVTTVTSQVITTDNTGGYKTYPAFQVQFATDDTGGSLGTNADCGYVLFAKGGTNYSVQIGEDQEKDTETVTLVNHQFKAGARGGFVDTNTITPLQTSWVHNGASTTSAKGLLLSSSSNVSKKYHGPLVVYSAPSSAYYATGDFEVNWKHVFACAYATATGKKQTGFFLVELLNANNEVMFAYGIYKSGTTNLNGTEWVYDYVNGKWPAKTFGVSYTGKAGYKSKSDSTGRLSNCWIKRRLTYDDDNNLTDCRTIIHNAAGGERTIVEDTPCTVAKVAFYFAKYSTNNYLHSNRVTQASFIVGDVDVINTFGSGDYAEVDCSSASIMLNNQAADSLGDVGNNWEDMYLDVGTNTMYVQYSPWVVAGYEPTMTMTYRKRWL